MVLIIPFEEKRQEDPQRLYKDSVENSYMYDLECRF